MIINIVGTSGSGKSTAVRALMADRPCQPIHVEGRATPIAYKVGDNTIVIGAYSPGVGTGGCDTIKDVVKVYDLILLYHQQGFHVIYEGLFVMNHTRGVALQRETKAVTVLQLTTTLDECKAGVLARRSEVNNTKKLDWKNTEGNHVRGINYSNKMYMAGATRIKTSREAILGHIIDIIDGHATDGAVAD